MDGTRTRFNGDTRVLHQRAVRIPLPDLEAERVFHENMMTVADARERKADLLADPAASVLDAYEAERDHVAESFRRRLRRIAGEDFHEAAMAYNRGERDDRIGALAAYYFEGAWRIQQHTTITALLFSPLTLRYPDSFTLNIRFASGYTTRGVGLLRVTGTLRRRTGRRARGDVLRREPVLTATGGNVPQRDGGAHPRGVSRSG